VPDTGRVMVATQARLWQGAAVAYTVAASGFFAFAPLLRIQSPTGAGWVTPFSLLGWGVFLPLLLPLVLTIIPLLVRRRRVLVSWICTAVLAAVCLFLALSAGLVFLPAPLFAAVGAYLTSRAPIEDEDIQETPWQVPRN